MTTALRCLAAVLLLAAAAHARDIHVDPVRGVESAEGSQAAPVKTIARGIRLAGPGDTVHLAPAVYRESAVFHNRHGEPGKPITLDGHGATLSGAQPLNVDDWTPVSPGLYRNDRLVRTHPSVIGRYFFRFDGVMNHMGRTSKGRSAALKNPADLAPGEWTFHADDGAFYVRIDPAKTLAECRIEAPIRSAGVQISGDCSHLAIRNITATHVYNDGFNIHGKTRHVRLENIAAIECGDDGVSAHDDCRIDIDGMVSVGNSTGACHTNQSVTTHNRCYFRDNIGFDFYVLNTGSHTLTHSVIEATAQRSIVVNGQSPNEPCTLRLDNVLVIRRGAPEAMSFGPHSIVEANRLEAIDMGLVANGRSVSLRRSVLAASLAGEITLFPGLMWKAQDNIYQARFLRVDQRYFTGRDFDAYQQLTGDASSRWLEGAALKPLDGRRVPGVGADAAALPPRR